MAIENTLFDSLPSPEEFIAAFERSQTLFGWAQAIEELPPDERCCQNYWKPLGEAIDAAQAAGDDLASLVCVILNAFCFNPLQENSSSRPFGDTVDTIARNVHEGRSPGFGLLPDDEEERHGWVHPIAFLQLEHYDLLRTIAAQLGDADLRARVADILWIVRRDYRMAQLAAESYLESARGLAAGEHWPHRADRLQRALRLARSLGQNNPSLPLVLAEVEAALNIPPGDATFFSAELMATLLSVGAGDAGACASLAEAAAQRAEKDGEWRRAVCYWNLAAKWHEKISTYQAADAARMAIAEVHIKHADEILNAPNRAMPHSHAAHWLQKAVEQLRRVQTPQARQREAEVHRRLLECQGHINGEMPVWAQSLDITEGAQAAMEAVRGLSIMEALGNLALLYTPPSPRELCRRNRVARRGHLLSELFPFVMFSPSGQVTARQQTHPGDRRAAKREKRRVEMLQAAHLNWNVVAQGLVLPALAQINDEHTIREADLLSIINGCLFVPPGHEPIFTRGLLAGVQGDWLIATHLLVPQIENSLHTLLLSTGVRPPRDVLEGQREWGMQEFLFDPDCWHNLAAIFGPNLLWDARALLAEDFGGHLRPLVEHGLLPDSAFDGSPFTIWCVYLWWLALRLCLHILQAQAQAQAGGTSEPAVSGDSSETPTEAV